MRLAIIGNAGSGKSTLAKTLADRLAVPAFELDALLWKPGWVLADEAEYERLHSEIIGQDRWIVEGLGRRVSIGPRLDRATHIILCDFPLWQHFWLAAERQITWRGGTLTEKPAGLAAMPPTKTLFRTIATVDADWMPEIRRQVDAEQRAGKRVVRIGSVEALRRFRWEG